MASHDSQPAVQVSALLALRSLCQQEELRKVSVSFFPPAFLCACFPVCFSAGLPVFLSLVSCACACLLICLACQAVRLPTCLSASLSLRLSASLLVCLLIYAFLDLSWWYCIQCSTVNTNMITECCLFVVVLERESQLLHSYDMVFDYTNYLTVCTLYCVSLFVCVSVCVCY